MHPCRKLDQKTPGGGAEKNDQTLLLSALELALSWTVVVLFTRRSLESVHC